MSDAVRSLVDQLAYKVPEPNRFHRAVWKLASTRPGAWLFARTAPHLDRLTLRLTHGRVALPELLAGIPVCTLVTTGARTGRRRSVPLLGVPFDGDLAVIGTRFGQKDTPAWYFNLRANCHATVEYRGTSVAVVASELDGLARDAAWDAGRRIYAGYEAYARRITGRQIRIMVLRPEPASA